MTTEGRTYANFVCARSATPKPHRKNAMAIYHLSVKPISRTDGRSATAAAAYRAAIQISDTRTGKLHDYRRKQGVVSAVLLVPEAAPKWAHDRSQVWNAAEIAEVRKNATVAREFEIALPAELNDLQRQQLAHEFAQELVNQHGCIADVAIHQPSGGGDQRNHHAHILLSTRRLGPEGFTDKTRELDDYSSGPKWVHKWRERYAQLQNRYLQQAGCEVRVDHRSYQNQGLDALPSCHLGPSATAYERRTGLPSKKRLNWEEHAQQRLLAAKEAGDRERELRQLDASILVLDGDLQAALAVRDTQPVLVSQADIDQGKLDFRSQFMLDRQQRQQKEQEQRAAAQRLERERWAEAQRIQAEATAKRLQEQREVDTAKKLLKQQQIERFALMFEEEAPFVDAALAALELELEKTQAAELAVQRRQQETQRLQAMVAEKLARAKRGVEQAVQRQQQIEHLNANLNRITQTLLDGLTELLIETAVAQQAALATQSALIDLETAVEQEALRRSLQLDQPDAHEPSGDVEATTAIDVLASEPELEPEPEPQQDRGYDGPGF